MSEALSPVEEAIRNPQSATPAYPLDQTEITVNIKAGGKVLSHKLKRPTLAQLIEREDRISVQSQAVSDTEEAIIGDSDDEVANAKLWDEIAVEVKGYRMANEPVDVVNNWRTTAELKKYIPAAHKSGAIRAMYQSTVELEKDDTEGFTLGAQEWTIRQTFGDPDFPAFLIRHRLRTPTENDRREFKRKATEVRFGRGSRRQTTKVLTRLKAYVDMYDLLVVGIAGATMNDQTWESYSAPNVAGLGGFIAAVDPIFKRQVVDCLMKEFDARVSD